MKQAGYIEQIKRVVGKVMRLFATAQPTAKPYFVGQPFMELNMEMLILSALQKELHAFLHLTRQVGDLIVNPKGWDVKIQKKRKIIRSFFVPSQKKGT